MRVDSNMFDKQITGTKSDVFSSENKTNNKDKEDLVKQSQNKEENASFPGEKKLIEAIEKSNKDFEMENSHLKFSIHEKTKQIVVKIVDNETKEVIKEIPSEKILDMVADMCERAGIFVDKRG